MNNEERKLLLQVYHDCLELESKNQLTEFGKGQLEICKILLNDYCEYIT